MKPQADPQSLSAPAAPRRFRLLGLILLILVGIALRLSDLPMVWQGQELIYKTPDAYYHLRRLMLALMAPDQLGVLDAWRGLEHTEPCIWPVQYSWLLAAWVWLLSLGQISQTRAEWLAAALPVVLALLTAWVVYALARRSASRWAWAAPVLYLLLPKNIDISHFTDIDHHIAETLAFSLALLSLQSLAELGGRRWLAAAAASLGLLYVVWGGSTLYMAILLLMLAGWALGRGFARAGALAELGLAFEIAAAGLACFYPWQGSWQWLLRYDRPSLFQPLVLLACGLSLQLLAWYRHERPKALASGALLLGVSALLVWPVVMGMDFLWGRGGGYPFVAQVSELHPLSRLGLPKLVEASTPLILVSPLLVLLLLRRAWRERRLSGYLTALALGCALALSLRNQRFLYLVTLLLPLLATDLLELGFSQLQTRLRWLLAGGIGLSSLYALGLYLLSMQAAAPAMSPDYRALSSWLRTHTPSPGQWLAARSQPAYAVLDNWDKGHFLLYHAQRPVVSDNFGLQASLLPRLLALPGEAKALALLDQSHARYLVVGPELLLEPPRWFGEQGLESLAAWIAPQQIAHQGQSYQIAHLGPDFSASVYSRLYFPEDGSLEPLQQLRLVYESPGRFPVQLFVTAEDRFVLYGETAPAGQVPVLSAPARFKVYERVPGALIEGQAEPASNGELSVEVLTNTNRRFTLRWPVLTDARGHYALRVPYGLSSQTGVTRAAGPYQLSLPGLAREISVSDAQVLQGARL